MPEDIREKNGRFARGGVANPGGRRGYGYETRFRKIFSEVFDEATIRASCIQLRAHIFGQRINLNTGKTEDDLLSTPNSRISAWTKMAEYAFGKPIQPVVMEQTDDGELMDVLRGMAHTIRMEKDERLEQFVDEARKLITVDKDLDGKPA